MSTADNVPFQSAQGRAIPRMTERVDNRVPDGGSLRKHDRKFGRVGGHEPIPSVDAEDRDESVGQPANDERGDADGDDFGHLQFLFFQLDVLFSLEYVSRAEVSVLVVQDSEDVVTVFHDGPNYLVITKTDDNQLLYEAEPYDAIVEGDVRRGSGEVVEGATDPEPFEDEAGPAHHRWCRPKDRPRPGCHDQDRGSLPRSLLPGSEWVRDDEVAINRYGGQTVDRSKSGYSGGVGVELASCNIVPNLYLSARVTVSNRFNFRDRPHSYNLPMIVDNNVIAIPGPRLPSWNHY